jgi:hypothetical protein
VSHSIRSVFSPETGSRSVGFCLRCRKCHDGPRGICIPSSIKRLSRNPFSGFASVSSVGFESRSHVLLIEDSAFWECSSLSSIFIPFSVETVGSKCFDDSSSLSAVLFESGSHLTSIGGCAFLGCLPLSLFAALGFCGFWLQTV